MQDISYSFEIDLIGMLCQKSTASITIECGLKFLRKSVALSGTPGVLPFASVSMSSD
ncbi:hypothetical protein OHAE_2968 [Ochrobactrum soli]|uniref:Uncharacterized protein n=1 Tax=Ochrobactrum soli TaxID=2448455 RepID=A0A2P9HG12_9HYPH|nr:hypothetical protein OHAE_2968 [[Ochrobactrum] soli]